MTSSRDRQLRVLILTYIYTDGDPRYGGEGRVVWETTNALARAGVEVHVITSMKRLAGSPHPNIRLYQIPFAKKNFLNFNAGELLKIFFWSIPLLFLKGIDVIHHLPTNGPDPFARFTFGRAFAMSADPAWDYDNPKFGEELRLDNKQKSQEAGFVKPSFDLSSRLALRFFRMIGVNEKFPKGTDIFFPRAKSLIPTLKELRPESELLYVPNGVDTATFRPDVTPLFPRTQKSLRFLHVGSISRRKGTLHLVNAFLSVLAKHPESELFLVGRGHPDFINELKQKASAHPEQVRFFDNVSNDDLPGAYASADVFCLVPLSGSTPTVMAEAFATGLPVISTRESGSGEAVEEHDAGFLVEAGNEEDLARAMTELIEHPERLREKAVHALAAARFFSWDNIAKMLIEGYERVLALKRPS
ncbi:MAG TPA: glycosyltransferase family 4 protein [Candidatus Paceibacterota bacterium]|nr:glycosyltransferase family 4 protein [Candidatus Paceibacterota bacterium]